jgi:hypothetical protein
MKFVSRIEKHCQEVEKGEKFVEYFEDAQLQQFFAVPQDASLKNIDNKVRLEILNLNK